MNIQSTFQIMLKSSNDNLQYYFTSVFDEGNSINERMVSLQSTKTINKISNVRGKPPI